MKISDIKYVIIIFEQMSDWIFKNKYEYFKKYDMLNKRYHTEKYRTTVVDRILELKTIDKDIVRDLTPFDKIVYNAICTLWDYHKTEFSIAEIYRLIIGNLKVRSDKLNEEIKNSIIDSILILQNIEINLNCDEEDLHINEKLLSCKQIEVQCGKNQIMRWKILSEPALLQYAKLRRRVRMFPFSSYNTSLHYTKENIILRNFLIEKVLSMRNNMINGKVFNRNQTFNKIRFIEIFNHLDIDLEDNSKEINNKKEKIIKNCEVIFEMWKVEIGILKDWNIDRKKGIFKIAVNSTKLDTSYEYPQDYDFKYSWEPPEGYVSMEDIKYHLDVLAESGLPLEYLLDLLEEVSVDIIEE